jgi:trigger factor
MQVAEKTNEGLKRSYSVTVPASDLAKQEEARLAEVAKDVRLPGFRPGKAPLPMIKQRYGASVRGEVLEKTIMEANRNLMSERGLRPAMQPQVEITEIDEGKDLTYTITFEVLPEVTPVDFKTITVERLVVEPTEADLDKAIEELAQMRKGHQEGGRSSRRQEWRQPED